MVSACIKPRSTDRAGIRLRVKAPVFRVLILSEAGGSHDEWGHACIRAVIWDSAHNGEAGAAMGAIREGIAEAPVFWIADIREAIGAQGAFTIVEDFAAQSKPLGNSPYRQPEPDALHDPAYADG